MTRATKQSDVQDAQDRQPAKGERDARRQGEDAFEELRKNGMMAHLLDALEAGKDIGHYGRLTFAMIARHFVDDDALVEKLAQDRDFSEEKARALVDQVNSRDYNPPRRERIAEWQKEQEFPICPSNDPDGCNVYRDLTFPDGIYKHIQHYHEEKAEAGQAARD